MSFLSSGVVMKYSDCGVFILVLCLVTGSFGDEKLNFNPDWKFIKKDLKYAKMIHFDDSSWKTVSLPHTYNDTDTFDDWSPAGHKGEMNQWGGRTWYRKHFVAPKSWEGKKVFIEFEAVRQWADVYLNGEKLGHSENGFIPFGFDLTPYLKLGKTNVLSVMCDNSFVKDEEGKHKWGTFEGGAKLPWNNPHWHPAHGGIYRNVYLHITDPVYLTLPLYSNLQTVGTYLHATNVSWNMATLIVEAQIKNEHAEKSSFVILSDLIDANGKKISSDCQSCSVAAGTTIIKKLKIVLSKPHLWEPSHPYLYSVRTRLVSSGKTFDSQTIPFGFRTVEFDRTSGFYINGRYLKLVGWGQKSTDEWPGLGAAQPDWLHDYTLRCMKRAGGNFVRWGHTAGGPAHIQSANRRGIITLQPGVDGEKDVTGHPWNIRLAAFRDMIIYYRNNPAILIWEGGNQSVSQEHVEALKKMVKTYDPSGGRVYAHRRCNSTVAPYCDITISTEGSGYQKALPTVEGEYNREESPRRIWDDFSPPTFGYTNAVGRYKLNSEQYAVNQVFQFDKIAPRHHCGGANWIFSDSTSGGRVQTEVARASGEVDGVRLPKEAYWVCKVLFTPKPDLHIIGHWTYPTNTVKNIYVASDCSEVELFLNGKSLGRKKAYKGILQEKKELHKNLFVFPKVAFEPGTLEAVGYFNGKEVDRQKLETVGSAVSLKITPITGPNGFLATGSDVALFDVEAVDEKGRRCPTFQQRCDFEVTGPVIWRGGYNSGKTNSINHTYLDLECGINRVAVRSTLKAGKVVLVAKSKGLKDGRIELDIKPVKILGGIQKTVPALLPIPSMTARKKPSAAEKAKVKSSSFSLAGKEGQIISDLSYSGPSKKVEIDQVFPNMKLFTDNDIKLKKIPNVLDDSEVIQLPDADWNYSAVDLIQFECKKDATVYVALDSRIKPMGWMKKYKKIKTVLTVGKDSWSIYRKGVKKGEAILMGSNTEQTKPRCRMMIIFVKRK